MADAAYLDADGSAYLGTVYTPAPLFAFAPGACCWMSATLYVM
jgi:hypothetical protein